MIRIQGQFRLLPVAVLAAMLAAPALLAGGFQVTDTFGRSVERHGVTLVDWEGQIANPAIEIIVTPPPDAGPFPTTATVSANHARLYFDSPSRIGAQGPSKVLTFQNATSSVPVRVSIFPDRDGTDEDYTLTLRLNSAPVSNSFPIHVLDQDIARPAEFAVTVDFSHDRSGFFDDPRPRAIVEQAAADWAYFISDMQLETVPAGSEATFVWGMEGSTNGVWATNAAAYRGFLFYASGVHNPELRSSGCASDCGFQRSSGSATALRRSGSCAMEIAGNYNSLGWIFTQSDDDWWRSGNLAFEPNDFYSIARHEVGHALFFSAAHTRFDGYKARGRLDDATVMNYQRAPLAIDGEDHFVRTVDGASGCGAFGSEYSGEMPRGRWLITKFDLLTAQALGYRIRQTSALAPLALAGGPLPQATTDANYFHRLPVTGGIPGYDFAIIERTLPAGLTLDRFTGVISGIPTAPGTSHFAVRVLDQDRARPVITAQFTLVVTPTATLAATGSTRDSHGRATEAATDMETLPGLFLMAEPVVGRAPSVTMPLYRVSPR